MMTSKIKKIKTVSRELFERNLAFWVLEKSVAARFERLHFNTLFIKGIMWYNVIIFKLCLSNVRIVTEK